MATVAEDKAAAKTKADAPVTETTYVPVTRVHVAEEEVDRIIRHHVYGAVALGLAPIPLVDVVGLLAIQMNLVRALSKKYGLTFHAVTVKPIVASLVGSVIPVAITPMVASFLKVIPVVGYTAGAASMSILGGASTYAVGQIFARHFAAGGTVHDFDAKRNEAEFKSEYEKGKTVAASGTAARPAAA